MTQPDLPLSLTFLGAAGTVTGSKFLLETGTHRVLVDCGLYQGDRVWRRRNWDDFPVDPATIEAVVVTHAHLDHSGYLPALAAAGFTGRIVCTPLTAQLVAIVLRDAAHLQEQEAHDAREARTSRHPDNRPLYDTEDAEQAIALLDPVELHTPTRLADGLVVTLHRAGHILGSAFAAVEYAGTRLVFSGDLGRTDHPLLQPPEPPGDADVVVVESTYGNRVHEAHGAEALAVALRRTLRRGGVALLPAFAVDRTAMLLYQLRLLTEAGRIPHVPVYLDSPMALRALEVYRAALHEPGTDFRAEVVEIGDPFDTGRLHLVPGPQESEQLNDPHHPCIVVSASGMATGGRVLHHLEHQLPHARNSVILTGFQVPGTRGRALADGARQLKIHGRYVPVRAEVVDVGGFSAHADSTQVLDWLSGSRAPRCAFVVHGEPEASEALAATLRDKLDWTSVVPRFGERVRVD